MDFKHGENGKNLWYNILGAQQEPESWFGSILCTILDREVVRALGGCGGLRKGGLHHRETHRSCLMV
jgi:hypothetical protein